MRIFAIKGDIIFSEAPQTLTIRPNAYAVCGDGLCAGVFDALPDRYAAIPVRDCTGRLVIPGLTDLHAHAPQYAFRALGMDMELLDWLDRQAFPQEARYADPDYARAA